MRAAAQAALWLVAGATSLCLAGRTLREQTPASPPAPPPALPRTVPPEQRLAVLKQAAELTDLARAAKTAPTAGNLEALSVAPLLDNPSVEGVGGVADWCDAGTPPKADWLYCRATRTVVPGGRDYQPSPATNE